MKHLFLCSLFLHTTIHTMEEKVGPIIKNGKIVVALIEQNHVTATITSCPRDTVFGTRLRC